MYVSKKELYKLLCKIELMLAILNLSLDVFVLLGDGGVSKSLAFTTSFNFTEKMPMTVSTWGAWRAGPVYVQIM